MDSQFAAADPQRLAGLMETAPVSPGTPLREAAGTRIGRYKLLQLIGEGGFGSVFMAEQETPVVRKVALKIIKLGMDTKQVIARFEAERQALALMDHPNIARVLDAGTTESGRPYFVMELVKGIPITEYCDQHNLTPRQRLDLFIPVCKAIQHAHQKGIIHRDLKPGNVLVTLHDGTPMPKVIDFGIAKAINQRLTEHTLFTEFRHFIGTPEYMSPEQAEISGLDVDTRSDVYSLGVLLYELLTSTTPFDPKVLREAAYAEIQRIIREVEPPKPSTRLSTLGDGVKDIASRRSTEPRKLRQLLSGELDWIIMRCLEKDRSRRYETPNALSRDIERYLNDDPVEACPPSTAYRLRRFIRKRRTMLSIATAFAAVLIAATVVSSWQAVRATRARNAEASQRTLAQRAAASLLAASLAVTSDAHPPANLFDDAVRLYEGAGLAENADFLVTRGEWRARTGRFPEAASDFCRVMDLKPTEQEIWSKGLALLLRVGDNGAYGSRRTSLLKQFASTTDSMLAQRIAKVSLIAPCSGNDLALAVELARRTAGDPYLYPQVKGMASYRQRQYRDAIPWIIKAAKHLDPHDHALAQFYLAMSYHQLGDDKRAADALTEGVAIARGLAQVGKHDLGHQFQDWIFCDIARRDAEASLHSPPAHYTAAGAATTLHDDLQNCIELADRALGPPVNASELLDFGTRHGRIGEFQVAAVALERAIQLQPDEVENYHHGLPLLLYVGNVTAYRHHRTEALRRFASTTVPVTAERIAKACLLIPSEPNELHQAGVLAERAVALGPTRWARFASGLAAYRNGSYHAAVKSLLGNYDAFDYQLEAASELFLAMAYHRLGRVVEAREALADGEAIMEAKLPSADRDDLTPGMFQDWIICQLARREAEMLINGSAPTTRRN